MERPIRQYGIKEPVAYTNVKWSSHNPNLLALGTAANFGIVGKGGVQIKSVEGPIIKTVAAWEEPVHYIILRKQFSMSLGSN